MDFEEESFDVIWAEASLHVVGFEEGLDAWRRFLAAEGFLVIHEMAWLRPDPPAEIVAHWRSIFPGIRTVDEYAAEIPRHGYDLMSDFALPEKFWWANYFRPLELRIKVFREKYRGDHAALAVLRTQEREVDLYRKYRAWYGSAYLVMQKQSA
ncbi:MAG: SAM-dependent methyltransferase, partial [Deltaproteobacteria bacterium]|nr:SAM-dependent methyltransferase [Deltaproteobacteria bacterium]